MTGWRVHAWVLMGNHYHLFIETPEASTSDIDRAALQLSVLRMSVQNRGFDPSMN